MNQQVKILAGCAAALLVLAGILIAVFKLPKKAESMEGTIPLNSGEVMAVTVTNANGTIELTKKDGEWAVKGLEKFSLSENAFTLANQAASLEAIREIPPTGNLEQYGLTEPEADAQIETSQGSRHLEIGGQSPAAGQRYVRLDGHIYLMDNAKVTAFLYSLNQFISTQVSDPLSSDDNVERIELKHGNETIQFRFVPEAFQGSGENEKVTPAHYRLTSPIEADIGQYEVSIWANGAFGLSAQAVEAMDPNEEILEKYGLAQPETSITLTSTSGQTIQLSASAPRDGKCYLMREGIPLIYRVSQADAGWRTATIETVTGSVFLPGKKESIISLKIEGQGKAYSFLRDGDQITCNGKSVKAEDFEQVLESATGMPPEFLGETAQPVLEPALKIEAGYGEGEKDILRLIPTGTGSLYLEWNGTARFTARESYLDALLEACEKAMV